MKSLRSLFFTLPAKAFFSLVLFIFSILVADCQVSYFSLFTEDNQSFVNAMSQVDSFNYEKSHYFKNTVRFSIESVIKLSMEYDEVFQKNIDIQEFISYYNSIGDSSFKEIYEKLSGIKGFSFALVNHTKRKIYSNISEINGADSGTNVRNYFGASGRHLLIARSCQNPYFATDYFIEYAEQIRRLAKKYDDSFDLYISFGTEESFSEAEKHYEELHFNMRRRIEKLNDTVLVYLAATVFIIAILLTVTGKHEPKGKTYPTVMNRLPNDLIVLMYCIVLVCLSSLYRTATSMIMTHGDKLGELWFTHSFEFYSDRVKFCIVFFICIATNLLCILKRQHRMGLLFKNTYIYTYLGNIKEIKKHSEK